MDGTSPYGTTTSSPSSNSQAVADMVIGACGLLTSIITAFLLKLLETSTGLAFYTMAVWFVIPAGALCCGVVAASGYYFGARIMHRKPTKILLLNALAVSVATFFLIQYLDYASLEVDGVQVASRISFATYLDTTFTHMQLALNHHGRELNPTGELGMFGYLVAAIEILGFAAGGFAVYVFLANSPYCVRCSRYLRKIGSMIRYCDRDERSSSHLSAVLSTLAEQRMTEAAALLRDLGVSKKNKSKLQASLHAKECDRCHVNHITFEVARWDGKNWSTVPNTHVKGFTQHRVHLG